MGRFLCIILLGLFLWTDPAIAAKDPIYLEPSSKWVLRYEDDSCKLIRTFGKDKSKVIIVMSRYGPGEEFRLTLAGKPMKVRRGRRDIKLQFGADEGLQEIAYMSGTMSDLPAVIVNGTLRIAAPTDEEKVAAAQWTPAMDQDIHGVIKSSRYAAAKYVLIDRARKAPIFLQTGSLEKPFTAFSKCVDELLTHWGIDVQKHKNLRRPATPVNSPGRWVRPKDYPQDMLSQGRQAIVEFRLSVDANGNTTQCHIQQSTRPQKFDDAVCSALMKRAKFKPALDATGEPIASFWRNTVRFEIPY